VHAGGGGCTADPVSDLDKYEFLKTYR
jgi:hypothetical protein